MRIGSAAGLPAVGRATGAGCPTAGAAGRTTGAGCLTARAGMLVLPLAFVLAAVTGCAAESPPSGLSSSTPGASALPPASVSTSGPDPGEADGRATTTERDADSLAAVVAGSLARMGTRQKAAQLLVVGFPGTSVTADVERLLEEGPVGGILLYGRNIEGPEQLGTLTDSLQRKAAAGGSGIPLLVAVDQEGGSVRRVREGVPEVPGARTAAATLTPAEVRGLAREQAEALLRMGVNTNLAPVADVVDDASSFLFERSYGGEGTLVSEYVSAVVEGQEGAGLISVVKHFPGHGAAVGDSHLDSAPSALGLEEFRAVHLRPFEAAVEAGAPAVLVSHLVAEGLGETGPATLSSRVIEGLLRGDLGFGGVVVTDDMEMAGLPGGGAAAADAVIAGADLVIVGHTAVEQRAALEALVAAAADGRLSAARLDSAVTRVLLLKGRYGLF